ncbi:hypothetical protein LJC60_00980 [Ruminococcaceae bacterium OttesenSCG-928-D13]|nr:hypothetical protein [Ruminococcaceae bacterium OttesenSCG-928-D13]
MKSGIIRKTDVFMPDYDHHSQMLNELGIADNRENASSKFVRFEITPPNDDVFSPLDTWAFRVDQDIVPEWFEVDPGKFEDSARTKLAAWAEEHIFIGLEDVELKTGKSLYLKDCKNITLRGNVEVERLEGSTVGQMREGSTVGQMWGSSTVGEMRESSTVGQMWGSSTVGQMWGSSTAILRAGVWGSTIKPETIILCDNATIKDNRTKTLYQAGTWNLVAVEGEKP